MSTRFGKSLLATLLSSTLLCSLAIPVIADTTSDLPDIGTTAGGTLSINQELLMGDFYLRQLRSGAPLIYDPLLTDYVNSLGQRLVAKADAVKTPFHFYLIQNNEINAFAFFGGNVVLHSSLFRETDNENQLASVMAHEISHVTQRHLARAMEEQQRNAPLTWVGALGSILLTMANPQAGMAALSTTIAGTQQGMISFTQSNEQEADRIGIRVLQRAGFDPMAMPDFMQKLADKYRYASKPPEMLLTHPMPDSRMSDTRSRAEQLGHKVIASSQDYLFAKLRILGMYGDMDGISQFMLDEYKKGNAREQMAGKYGQAILYYKSKQYDAARNVIQPLLTQQPSNVWFLDLATDIDLEQNRAPQAVSRLEQAIKSQPNSAVLQLNLGNAYIEARQAAKATTLLNRYTYSHPEDPNGWDLLAKAAADQGLRDEELAARAESMALLGRLDQAINLLTTASSSVQVGSLKQARYDARIDQLRQLQQRFKQFERS
ncbi:beta-barrel assembly-enhancing protease [Limnobaculum parvum]|uniref:Beta-barrel assembly-enhancing protease n=1 Tax=Limnobaculum parvum TaxID=2172103 RepID=A0A2Y9U0U9_9GAMM|nr:M48 family metallopeptidase [Limnobaculum parvum]AWH89607.1 M48 family peptidase [Limnobaculum parvum]